MTEQQPLQSIEQVTDGENAASAASLAPLDPNEIALPHTTRAAVLAIAGWLVPGLGHALLRMWGRAIVCFLTVGILCFTGAKMRGNIFTSDSTDPFATLGFMADLGAGSFYPLARMVETSGPDVSHADGDYGTRFLAAAGVLNLLFALHAYEAARGRKA